MRGEVADGAEALAGGLEATLAVTNGHEQVFEPAFRFESEGHTSCLTWLAATGQRETDELERTG